MNLCPIELFSLTLPVVSVFLYTSLDCSMHATN
jgi:hypothetical protein